MAVLTYAQAVTLAKDAAFRDKIKAAIMKAGIQIQGEAFTNTNAFAKRAALATALLANPDAYVDRFAWGVASAQDLNSATSPSDADIAAGVSSQWNDFAGVNANDT